MLSLTIGVIGDYNAHFPPQATLEPALQHAAAALHVTATVTWIPTTTLATGRAEDLLDPYDGIFGAPGDVHSVGIRLRRDNWVSVRYAEELNSGQSSVLLQRADLHGMLGQKPPDLQGSL